MSSHNATRAVTLVAAADLSAKQFYFAKASGTGVDVSSVAQSMPLGIIGEGVPSGDRCPVILPGCIAQVIVGSGGITAGGQVATSATGTCIAVGASNGHIACGVALETAAEGAIAEILFGYQGQINA